MDRFGFMTHVPGDDPAVQSFTIVQDDMTWVTTSMLPSARNHCAAVAAVNTFLGLTQLQLCAPADFLEKAYLQIGEGPVLRGAAKIRRFMSLHGAGTSCRPVFVRRTLLRALRGGRPVLLLVLGPAWGRDWHWVVACGFTLTQSGKCVLHIADGWHTETRYFVSGVGSRWLWGSAFALDGLNISLLPTYRMTLRDEGGRPIET